MILVSNISDCNKYITSGVSSFVNVVIAKMKIRNSITKN